ncbi:hypothetical protein ASPCADRAFT_207632 [Aspergillus carbonarius ITEM 5010]|uniref:Uncharacterized protein n=1 Tax=Aspergillus carbonarius (strain ITEM 5010) TaxID=602072 RepID=A0A1R3RKQ8_ASPC5|nr:hypothetical protein ASPCADRAFT_405899 [Aspergillus carbonarius ITEM 5010]OOF95139.1 hypothetical protein ASPCADRAFT_207632 [Aspergillus carbonarius ITEM 5010]
MSNQNMNKKSWESLSSTFSQLEVSISHDSCYASDEVSVTSTSQVGASALAPATGPSVGFVLKPILKRPYSEIEESESDSESESGYASEASDSEYDAIFEDSDDDDDDIYYITGWDKASIMSESCDEDDAESFAGSFISFGPVVRFDTNIRYIDAPVLDDESSDAELTCHELMERARASGTLRFQETCDNVEEDDDSMPESMRQLPEEHPSDVIDLDKRLFVAYMNGMHEIPDRKYRSRLHNQANDFSMGRLESPYLDLDNASASGAYFDNVLNHVIGLFRNIVAKEDFGELASLINEEDPSGHPLGSSRSQELLAKIEHILAERLACDANIGPDELSFFASGVAYALENWRDFLVR